MTGGLVLVADVDEAFLACVAAVAARLDVETEIVTSPDAARDAARRRRPDAAVIEVGLRAASGYALCRELRTLYGERLPIVLVSADRTDRADRIAGLLLGADEYLAKPVDADELAARLRRALARATGYDMPGTSARTGHWHDDPLDLTERELQVLHLLAAGYSSRAIGDELVISAKTVSSHVQHILAKLGVHTRAQAVVVAFERGLARPAMAIAR